MCVYADMHHVSAETGIAPTTPGRGNKAAPFKLVAPNADMKDIPATIVVCLHLWESNPSIISGIVRGPLACIVWRRTGIVLDFLRLHMTGWIQHLQACQKQALTFCREPHRTGRVVRSEAGLQAAAQSRRKAMTTFALRSMVQNFSPSAFAFLESKATRTSCPPSATTPLAVVQFNVNVDAGASGSVAGPSYTSGAGMAQPAIQYRYCDASSPPAQSLAHSYVWHVSIYSAPRCSILRNPWRFCHISENKVVRSCKLRETTARCQSKSEHMLAGLVKQLW